MPISAGERDELAELLERVVDGRASGNS